MRYVLVVALLGVVLASCGVKRSLVLPKEKAAQEQAEKEKKQALVPIPITPQQEDPDKKPVPTVEYTIHK